MIYPIKISQLLKEADGALLQGSPEELIRSFSTDSRALKQGDFFIAVRGENFDGHKFIEEALEKGAKGVITDDSAAREYYSRFPKCAVIKVKNTLNAYLAAAGIYLNNFNVEKIGITGSVGKTTVKEMVAHILEARYKVLKPEGSFNNEIGIPQTIFKLERSHEVLVLELAMRGPGQIAQLCGIVKPQTGIITVIGESHYEFMHSYEAIASAKAELFESLPQKGAAIINNDDKFAPFLKGKTKAQVITYAVQNQADFKAANINDFGLEGMTFDLVMKNNKIAFTTKLLGRSNVLNLAAALAAGVYFGVTEEDLRKRAAELLPVRGRLQKKKLPGGVTVINDSYNASPASAGPALDVLSRLRTGGRKIAVLADMLELGEIEKEAHYNIGKKAAQTAVDFLIVLGGRAEYIKKGAVEGGFSQKDIFTARNNKEAAKKLKEIIKEGDLVLLKGSRKMKLEEIEQELAE